MRALKTSVLLAVLLLIAAPAHAWWGWLDDLSGPGRFRGPQFEFRLVCFGEESEAKKLVDGLKNANELTRKIVRGNIESINAAGDAWRQLEAELNATRLTFPVLETAAIERVSIDMNGRWEKFRETLVGPGRPSVEAESGASTTFLNSTNAQVQPLIAAVVRGISSINSTGIFLSACSTDNKRRSSIELGTGFWYADGNSSFANGEQIRLTTLMPEFSLRVFTDPRFDFLDAGVGAGIYWFTSKGFNSFSGVVLQPGRLDFHAPTLWATYPLDSGSHILRRIAAAPTFRFGLTMFPAGFSPDAFAGVGDKHVRIPGELIKSWTLFINLEPFVRKAPFVKAKGTGIIQ